MQRNYNLHMNRLLLFIISLCLVSQIAFSQNIRGLRFNGYSSGYISVTSYDGVIANEAFTSAFEYTGKNINVPNWKMSVELVSPFKSSDGLILSPEYINFVPKKTVNRGSYPNPLPSITDIIGNNFEIPLINGVLVPKSNVPIEMNANWNSYYGMELKFDLRVQGGEYLTELRGKEFVGVLIFKAYHVNGQLIESYLIIYMIRVNDILTGTPPQVDKFSISFSPEVVNGALEYNTAASYFNRNSVTYKNALTINSNKNYQITVKASSPNFVSTSDLNRTIPVGVVYLKLSNATNTSNSLPLSNNVTTILNGTSSDFNISQIYDIEYFTTGGTEFMNALPEDAMSGTSAVETYATTLEYTITAP